MENGYALEIMAQERIAEMRATATRMNQIRAVRSASRPLRVRLGSELRWMGNFLLAVRGILW